MKTTYYIIDECVSRDCDRELKRVSYRKWIESINFQIDCLRWIGMGRQAEADLKAFKAFRTRNNWYQTINGFTYVKTTDSKKEAEAWLL